MRVLIVVNQTRVDAAVHAACLAAHAAGGWHRLQGVTLVGDPSTKSEVFDRLTGCAREGVLRSLIQRPGGYYHETEE